MDPLCFFFSHSYKWEGHPGLLDEVVSPGTDHMETTVNMEGSLPWGATIALRYSPKFFSVCLLNRLSEVDHQTIDMLLNPKILTWTILPVPAQHPLILFFFAVVYVYQTF